MANKRITQLPTAPQVEDNDYIALDNTSTPTAENEGGTRKILVKDITAKSADAVEYDNTTSGLEADNVQDAIDEVLEEGGKVQDVYENGESVVDPTDKIARIHGHKEVTQAQYDALPSSKLTDGILYCIKDAEFSAEDVPYDNSDSGLESEDVQSAVDEIADVLGALKVEGTVENQSIATFTDGSSLPMPKLEVAVEPQQDLHGYDAPWVGGAGKNKLNLEFSNDTSSFSGLTFSHTDSTFKLKGTVSEQSYKIFNLTLPPNVDLNTDYTLSATVTGTVDSCLVGVYFKNGNTDVENIRVNISDTTPKITKQVSAQFDNALFIIEGLQSGSYFDCEVKIQLEKGGSATTFAPYSNICPIIGWSAVDVTRTGKNLWGGEKFADDIVAKVPQATKDTTNKTVTYFASQVNGKTLFDKFKENTRYTIYLSTTSTYTNAIIIYSDGTYDAIEPNTYKVTYANKTVSEIRGSWASGTTVLKYEECGIFEGVNTAQDFEPYNGQTYIIQLGSTYYGGKLDVVSGVLTVDRAYVDLGTLTWGKASLEATITYTSIQDKKSGVSPILCSSYKYESDKGFGLNFGTISDSSNQTYINYVFVRNQDFSGKTDLECKTAMNGVQLVYELATPTTIQLSPTQVNSLMGVNNIFADCGKINKAVYIRDLNIVINNLLNG